LLTKFTFDIGENKHKAWIYGRITYWFVLIKTIRELKMAKRRKKKKGKKKKSKKRRKRR